MRYLLNGFGYADSADFNRSVFKLLCVKTSAKWTTIIATAITGLVFEYTGMDMPVFMAFIFLIVAEFWTGVKVSVKMKKERFRSRKFGRMILKIGVYIMIITVLHVFSKRINAPDLMGLSLNPFTWLYYTVLVAIVLQMVISWLENLGSLGYKETKTIAGFILRKLNKWFEFDGTKDNGEN